MSYASIDRDVGQWCASHGLKLSKRFAGQEARFCYTSSPQGECFQIWIDPPATSRVTVHAASVETNDDVDVSATWTTSLPEIKTCLDEALRQVNRWKAGQQRNSA